MSDDIIPALPSKSEAWELTDEIRQGYESIHTNRMDQVNRLARAYETRTWEVMGYDSFDEYHYDEFGEDLQHQRLELEDRVNAVKVLSDAGITKAKIAEILGIHRNTVSNLVKRIDAQEAADAQRCASNEVDAAGQSVEEVGLIEDDDCPSQPDPEPTPRVINISQVSEDDDNESEEERQAQLASWLDTINFDAMVIPVSNQIIEAETSQTTPEYFTPRPVPARPLEVIKPTLPPPPTKAYDASADLLGPPMELAEVLSPNKDDHKHCRTCACNLLP